MVAEPEISELCPVESTINVVVTTAGTSSNTVSTENVACGRSDGNNDAPVPAKLESKFHQLRATTTWWALVPNPFMALIAFCVGFALLSLIGLVVMAASGGDERSNDHGGGSDETTSSSILLVVGLLSSVVGSLQTASGYCAQRLSHQITTLMNRSSPVPEDSDPKPHPLFFVGLLLLVCGTIAAITNLGILGQSVTAPFAAMTLIFNGCLASCVLHEAVSKYDIIATVLVLVGVAIAMLGVGMAHLDVQAFTLSDIEAIFVRSPFPAIYSILTMGLLVASYVIVQKRGLQTKAAGLCCFSIGAGLLSGFSSLCVKCTVEVLKGVSKQDSSDLTNPVLYLFVAGIPVCVLSQLKLMTLGLRHFGTLKFVPPYHAFIILSNLTNGMVYFDEASGYDAASASLFIAGCLVTVGGVFVLLAKAPQADEDATGFETTAGKESSANSTSSSSTETETETISVHSLFAAN